MDRTDREIIANLQLDGRMSVTELAGRISLSPSATGDRLRHLQRSGVIRHFAAVVDTAAVGRPIEALIDVRLAPGLDQARSDAAIAASPMVVEALHLTGRFDVQLRVAARDVAELDQLLGDLKDHAGAEETNTRLILRNLDGFPRAPEPAPGL